MKHKVFNTPDDIIEFVNDRTDESRTGLYIDVKNIVCDNNGKWHLFYKKKYYINNWFNTEED